MLLAWEYGWIGGGPVLTRRVPWAGTGVWLKAETHTHTKFSDGGSSVDELADHAAANGCDVLAITDHSDGNLTAATQDTTDRSARRARGFRDWSDHRARVGNPPPGKGRTTPAMLLPAAWDTAERTAQWTGHVCAERDSLAMAGEDGEQPTRRPFDHDQVREGRAARSSGSSSMAWSTSCSPILRRD